MTLIVGVLTNVKNYLIADKMHSLDGTKENPVTATVKTGETTIKLSSPKIRIDGGTKIYQLTDNILIAGAGDLEKVKNFIQAIKEETAGTIIEKTQDYYTDYKTNSPDSLLILIKKAGVSAHFFSLDLSEAQKDEMFSFVDWKLVINENSIGVLAIGSGMQIFQSMYKSIKNDCLERYREAIRKNEYSKWETWFIGKIKQMYTDVSKYDDAVSDDIDIIELQ